MTWNVLSTQSETAYFDDVVREILASAPAPLPVHDRSIGQIETHWHVDAPGVVYIAANPEQGSPEDRIYACKVVEAALSQHGYKRLSYELWEPINHVDNETREAIENYADNAFERGVEWAREHKSNIKTATWGDVQAKAKRLIQSGKVIIKRNGANVVQSQVQGDHGTYEPEIHRDDPNSNTITNSYCNCDWGSFQNLPRTRQWKRFQNRPCAHILATYWQSLATPLDEDRAPGDNGQQGQMMLPGMSGPSSAPSSMGIMQQAPTAPSAWFNPQTPDLNQGAGGAEGVQAPTPESVLPQFQNPMEGQMPSQQLNGVSVPGARGGPTALNPMQMPGTYSSEQSATMQHMSYENGDLVHLLNDDYGEQVGRSEEHGAGSTIHLPRGLVGEVLGTHPSTGMVNVLYSGKPWEENGPMEPWGAQAWHFPSDLVPRPDLKKPGPAIRRT